MVYIRICKESQILYSMPLYRKEMGYTLTDQQRPSSTPKKIQRDAALDERQMR